jgi:metallo-beta-lactamase family protein
VQLTFLGATGTVTGSKYLLTTQGKQFLVDCGLFQGLKELRLKNWEPLPIDPRSIDAVILTHAHIDHSGYIPLLVKNGFRGRIYCSRATRDLCSILLPDSGYLHEEDARRANKYGYSKHKPALPLYTKQEAEIAMDYFYSVDFGKNYKLDDGVIFHLNRAGHIMGSSFVTLKFGNKLLVFSGDLGRMYDPVIKPPAILQFTDYLVIESTYGDRLHGNIAVEDQICDIVNRTLNRDGTVLIPSFAVGRTQNLMYYLNLLKKTGRIPDVPIYLDSPLAIEATKVFCSHIEEQRLSHKACQEVSRIAHYASTCEQSKAIDANNTAKIIISASGMATGGRVLHHLKVFVTDPKNTILFAGYQAEDTRGDRMVRGEKEIKIHGEIFPVRAEIALLHNISAHADYDEILQWLSHFKKPPRKVFITHGEEHAAKSLQIKIQQRFGWQCIVPQFLHKESL